VVETEVGQMADVVYVAVTAGFFYLTWLFVKLCDRL
jgi:hypothetical protein